MTTKTTIEQAAKALFIEIFNFHPNNEEGRYFPFTSRATLNKAVSQIAQALRNYGDQRADKVWDRVEKAAKLVKPPAYSMSQRDKRKWLEGVLFIREAIQQAKEEDSE